MLVRVEVAPTDERFDARGAAVLREFTEAGADSVERIEVRDVYFLAGERLDADAVARICDALLVDPVVQAAAWREWNADDKPAAANDGPVGAIEVAPLPGVTDTAGESLRHAALTIGLDMLDQASTGLRYVVHGSLDAIEASRIARSTLANEVVQAWALDRELPAPFTADTGRPSAPETVHVRGIDDEGLLAISQQRRLALDLGEMRAIAAHFGDQGRDPTDLELEMLAQTWSEHCVHKTFKALIHHTEPGHEETVDSMYKSYIKAATKAADSDWLKSVFVDNAGIVGFDDTWDIAFKVETHNHPSALEPFGGANTGVGGVVRDVIGVSAYPIATTDVLCFGPDDLPADSLPEGVLHPRRIAAGVTAGIEDYGNKMGIPTVNGAILYDRGYTANPLVFCGCLGVLPRGSHRTDPRAGDHVVVLGGRTGRDGLRGATFSSMEMGMETALVAGSSVQIGHPIAEKAVLEAVKIARTEGLYTAITDCGAGGLSSAVGEMASELGAVVHLERAPLKYEGLSPWEVWLSEAQERMVVAVPEADRPRLQEVCDELDVEMTVLGTFSGDGRLQVLYRGELVGDLDVHFLHDGIPRRVLTSHWEPPASDSATLSGLGGQLDIGSELLAVLATGNVRSKEDVVRTYDHEVQGGTIVKPFVGVQRDGPADAAVIVPLDAVENGPKLDGPGVALAVGINPQYGKLDPYAMSFAAIDECFRNLVATGADPDQVAILDNFCWGNPKLPDRLGALVRCARGCYDAALAYGAPFISGKDSLNNEYTGADGAKHAIPGTLLISGLGIVPDASKTATSDFKKAGNRLYVVGETRGELGGSIVHGRRGQLGAVVPQPVADPMTRLRAVHRAISGGLVASVHDCSEGGLAVALAEMAIGGLLGATVDLDAAPGVSGLSSADATGTPAVAAFSESAGRFVVEVGDEHVHAFEALFDGVPIADVGEVSPSGQMTLRWAGVETANLTIHKLRNAWRGHVDAD